LEIPNQDALITNFLLTVFGRRFAQRGVTIRETSFRGVELLSIRERVDQWAGPSPQNRDMAEEYA
jgi:hypothetical protein